MEAVVKSGVTGIGYKSVRCNAASAVCNTSGKSAHIFKACIASDLFEKRLAKAPRSCGSNAQSPGVSHQLETASQRPLVAGLCNAGFPGLTESGLRKPGVPKAGLCRPGLCRTGLQKSRASTIAVKASAQAATAETGLEAEQSEGTFSLQNFEQFLLDLQSRICNEAEAADGSGATFCEDKWSRGEDPKSGYGITRVLEGGVLLEKAAANVSIVRGVLSEARAKAMSGRGQVGAVAGAPYFAGALSLVFHSASPMVPTFRSDVRYFEIEGQPGWFGGGADLTPSYLFEEDARDFHGFYKALCDRHGSGLYPEYKALCDKYFYIPARKEHRGLGGIFFDDLSSIDGTRTGNGTGTADSGSRTRGSESTAEVRGTGGSGANGTDGNGTVRDETEQNGTDRKGTDGKSGVESRESSSPAAEGSDGASVSGEVLNEGFERAWQFTRDVAEGFMPSYLPIAARGRGRVWGDKERQWQLLRRGRYLEFNLLYDRGVKFGLDGGGRVESIMVSAPPLIAWSYNVEPEAGSPEAEVMEVLRKPRDWA